MDRDDFEQWLDDNGDEAIRRIEGERRPLESWIRLYGVSLTSLAREETARDEDNAELDDDLDDDDDLSLISEDDES